MPDDIPRHVQAKADSRQRTLTTAVALMEAPAETERAGDEFHREEHWVACEKCGCDNPEDYSECFNCGAVLRSGGQR